MNLKFTTNQITKYFNQVTRALKSPLFSIFAIFGIPFVFALIWSRLSISTYNSEHLLLFFLYILGLNITFLICAYYTGNKLLSAILGLLLAPLTTFFLAPADSILALQFIEAHKYLVWSSFFRNIPPYMVFVSLTHSIMGYLVAFRSKEYVTSGLLLFIVEIFGFIGMLN